MREGQSAERCRVHKSCFLEGGGATERGMLGVSVRFEGGARKIDFPREIGALEPSDAVEDSVSEVSIVAEGGSLEVCITESSLLEANFLKPMRKECAANKLSMLFESSFLEVNIVAKFGVPEKGVVRKLCTSKLCAICEDSVEK